jgi:hypothetical protein
MREGAALIGLLLRGVLANDDAVDMMIGRGLAASTDGAHS